MNPLVYNCFCAELVKLAESDKLGGELPPPFARAQAYANLAAHLFEYRRVDPVYGRTRSRVVRRPASIRSAIGPQ